MPDGDGRAEGGRALARRLARDDPGEQAGGELRVLRLLADQLGGALDGEVGDLVRDRRRAAGRRRSCGRRGSGRRRAGPRSRRRFRAPEPAPRTARGAWVLRAARAVSERAACSAAASAPPRAPLPALLPRLLPPLRPPRLLPAPCPARTPAGSPSLVLPTWVTVTTFSSPVVGPVRTGWRASRHRRRRQVRDALRRQPSHAASDQPCPTSGHGTAGRSSDSRALRRSRERAPRTYWPSLPRPAPEGAARPSVHDGGRSHSPLRGSPGFPPGSLLPRPPPCGGDGRTSCVGHHILWRRRIPNQHAVCQRASARFSPQCKDGAWPS